MADKKVSLRDLTIFNDESLIFLRRAVKILEAQSADASIAPISAVGTITITSIPNLDETITIGSQIFTWKDIRTTTGEVTRGVNAYEAANNLITAVNSDISNVVIASLPPGNANCITTITSIPTTKGTGYSVGDILTLSDGTGGSVIVLTISGAGVVETTSLYTSGTNYTIGLKTCSGGYGSGCIIAITALGNPPVNVNSILTITSIPATKGTGYKVGDILTLVPEGVGGKVRVETISGAGLVETVSLYDTGMNYTIGNHSCIGGYGTGCIITVTAIGNEATVLVTSVIQGFIGNSIIFSLGIINTIVIMNGNGFLGGTIQGQDSSTSNRQRLTIDAVGAAPTEGTTSLPVNIAAGTQFLGMIGDANITAGGFSAPIDQREQNLMMARRSYSKVRSKLVFN
jgi:hypothetical protein